MAPQLEYISPWMSGRIPGILTRPATRAYLIGVLVGLAHFVYHALTRDSYPGDYFWALAIAQALALGNDPYGFTPTPGAIPYPIPASLFGFPLLWTIYIGSAVVAGSIFVGTSAGILSWGMMRAQQTGRLLAILLSGVFWEAVMLGQWSPLIVASWYLPALAPLLVLVKPNIALPVVVSKRPSVVGLLIAEIVLLASLVVYPTWPWRFLGMIGPYQSTFPVLIMPFGPLLLLALVRWREERGRLLFLMSMLPIRAFYDLLSLWLVPRTTRQALALSALSWLVFVGPIANVLGATLGILSLYLAALALVFGPAVAKILPPLGGWFTRTLRGKERGIEKS